MGVRSSWLDHPYTLLLTSRGSALCWSQKWTEETGQRRTSGWGRGHPAPNQPQANTRPQVRAEWLTVRTPVGRVGTGLLLGLCDCTFNWTIIRNRYRHLKIDTSSLATTEDPHNIVGHFPHGISCYQKSTQNKWFIISPSEFHCVKKGKETADRP